MTSERTALEPIDEIRASVLNEWVNGSVPAVVKEWIAFAAGGCTDQEIRAALQKAPHAPEGSAVANRSPRGTTMDRDDSHRPPALLEVPLFPPEREAWVRALAAHEPPPSWAVDAVVRAWPPDAPFDPLVAWADGAAERLLAIEAAVSGCVTATDTAAIRRYLHYPWVRSPLTWTAQATACLEAIETTVVLTSRGGRPDAEAGDLDVFRSSPTLPIEPDAAFEPGAAPADPTCGPAVDLVARMDLAVEWWATRHRLKEAGDAGAAAGQRVADQYVRFRQLLRGVLAGLVHNRAAGTARSTTIAVEMNGVPDSGLVQPQAVTLPGVEPAALMRALTGTIAAGARPRSAGQTVARVVAPPTADSPTPARLALRITVEADGRDPRRVFLDHELLSVEPEVLSPRVVPPAWFAVTLDDRSALVTGRLATSSIRLFEDGGVEAQRNWPRPLVAEIPWGSDGSRLAWTRPYESWLLLQGADGTHISEVQSPFVVERVFPQPDGSAFITALIGGLWRWCPGCGFTALADTPPVIWLEPSGPLLRLDPYWRNAEFNTVRRVETRALLWDPASGTTHKVALDGRGAVASRAVRDGWTATAYPQADLIEIAHEDGRSMSLACYYPWCVAWAGSSLLVCLWTGEVLFFPRLLDLDVLRARQQ